MRGMPVEMCALGAFAVVLSSSPVAGDLLFDQIGDEPFSPTAMSSSQFGPKSPDSAITTVDNFSLFGTSDGDPIRLTRIEAAVGGLTNFVGFELIDSWTVQIYSSLEASYTNLEGDIFSASFETGDATGWSAVYP